jgi:nitroreductase
MSASNSTLDVIEAIWSTRSMRRLKPDPIPDEVLHTIFDAAIRAPSGSNQQTWGFIVVRDPKLKQQLQQWYYAVAVDYFQSGPQQAPGMGGAATMQNVRASARHLAEHLHEAPVLVLACIRGVRSFALGSSIYPAVQNLMLAARACGVGSTLTTFHLRYESEVKELLGIPEDVHTAALIPLGYPTGRWETAKRAPVEQVVFLDHYGDRLWEVPAASNDL